MAERDSSIKNFRSDINRLLDDRKSDFSSYFMEIISWHWNIPYREVCKYVGDLGWKEIKKTEFNYAIYSKVLPNKEIKEDESEYNNEPLFYEPIYKPPTVIIVKDVPRAKVHVDIPNSDGQTSNSIDDGHCHVDDEEYCTDELHFEPEDDILFYEKDNPYYQRRVTN